MEQRHRGHLIRAGAGLNPKTNEWTPTLMVFWSQGGDTIRKRILFKSTFPTEEIAQERACQFAVAWIDVGKPEIPPD